MVAGEGTEAPEGRPIESALADAIARVALDQSDHALRELQAVLRLRLGDHHQPTTAPQKEDRALPVRDPALISHYTRVPRSTPGLYLGAVLDAVEAGYVAHAAWQELGGRAEPVAFLIEAPSGKALTADAIRRYPIGRVFEAMRVEEADQALGQFFATGGDDALDVAMEKVAVWLTQGRRTALTRQHLTEVALVYRRAYAAGMPPRKAVAARFVLSDGAAAKQIMAARRMGLLGPARPGSKGGEGEIW